MYALGESTPDTDPAAVAFRDVLFLMVLSLVVVIFLMTFLINPVKKTDEVPIRTEILIEAFWPTGTSYDVDLWGMGPDGVPVGWGVFTAGPALNLERDDRAAACPQTAREQSPTWPLPRTCSSATSRATGSRPSCAGRSRRRAGSRSWICRRGRHAIAAGRMPGHVPVRARTRLTVELRREALPDAHEPVRCWSAASCPPARSCVMSAPMPAFEQRVCPTPTRSNTTARWCRTLAASRSATRCSRPLGADA